MLTLSDSESESFHKRKNITNWLAWWSHVIAPLGPCNVLRATLSMRPWSGCLFYFGKLWILRLRDSFQRSVLELKWIYDSRHNVHCLRNEFWVKDVVDTRPTAGNRFWGIPTGELEQVSKMNQDYCARTWSCVKRIFIIYARTFRRRLSRSLRTRMSPKEVTQRATRCNKSIKRKWLSNLL